MIHTHDDLVSLQSLPLDVKIQKTKNRIREWVDVYGVDGVYVAFSGGKDSTVLLDICRSMYPDIRAVFVDTGLEYPELREFVKTKENVEWLKPRKTFKRVITEHGYPMFSKHVAGIVYGGKKIYDRLLQEGFPVWNRTAVAKLIQDSFMKTPGEWGSFARCMGMMTKDKTIKAFPSSDEKAQFGQISKNYQPLLYAPFYINDYCCRVMKKNPTHSYQKKYGRNPITGVMASESADRKRTG